MSGALAPAAAPLASFGGAIEFIFTPQSSNVTGGAEVGGLEQVLELTLTQLEVTFLALALALAVALPIGLYLGHRGVGETLERLRRKAAVAHGFVKVMP